MTDRIAEIENNHATMPVRAFSLKFAQEYLSEAHKDRGDLLQALAASEARVKEFGEELTRLQRLVCNCPRTYNDGVNMDRPHEESCPVVNRDWKHSIHPEIWQGEIIARQTNRIGELEARVKELEAQVFVPGMRKCAKCGFVQMQAILRASDGAVGVKVTSTPEICPNGCGPLWQRTERDAGK